MIHQPELLLLDEPFAALDAFTREDMWELLQRLWERTQCTSMLVTHDPAGGNFLYQIRCMSWGLAPSHVVYILKVESTLVPRTLDYGASQEGVSPYVYRNLHAATQPAVIRAWTPGLSHHNSFSWNLANLLHPPFFGLLCPRPTTLSPPASVSSF